jgi:2-oxoglutarate ferredoxin oxidoreductase subunit delta
MSTSESSSPGAAQPASAKPKKAPPDIVVRVSWCKGCGLCVDYCSRGVIKMDGVLPVVVDAEKCTRCMQCEAICPDFAIEVKDRTPADAGDKRS